MSTTFLLQDKAERLAAAAENACYTFNALF